MQAENKLSKMEKNQMASISLQNYIPGDHTTMSEEFRRK